MENLITLPNQRTEIKWTNYLATAYSEGFCEGENASLEESLEGWACLILTGVCWRLQGYFGRNARHLIDEGIITEKGFINWYNIM